MNNFDEDRLSRMGYTGLSRIEALRHKSGTDPNWVHEDIYRLLYNGNLYVAAYERIKSKPGNMTPGADKATLDGFSLETISNLISAMRNESFQFSRARRIAIPKANGGSRPLGIATPRDKIVQEVIRMILEAIYEPIFLDCSHGFRTHRGCHTALRQIRNEWSGTTWIIEGDIKGCFDNIDHSTLIGVLKQRINDSRFINLIWKSLRAGYLEFTTPINSLSGTPQGSIVSPLLANIYLHELDRFVKAQVIQKHERGSGSGRSKLSPEYRRAAAKLAAIRQRMNTSGGNAPEILQEFRSAKKQLLRIPAMKDDTDFIRVKYVRYADDWVIGINGPRNLAELIRNEVGIFLSETLKLSLSGEKTHIRHAKSEEARFLGTRVKIGDKNPKVKTIVRNGNSFTKRVAGWTPKLLAPVPDLITRLATKGMCTTAGVPTANSAWSTLDDNQIVEQYSAILRGITNYYSFVDNFRELSRVQFILKYSAAKTLAAKHRSTVPKIFRRYGKRLTVSRKNHTGSTTNTNMYEIGCWASKPRRFMNGIQTDRVPMSYKLRSRSKLGESCSICSEPENVEMHHIRHVRKSGEKNTGFGQLLATINRKQIPVCRTCHMKIHAGKYDGLKLSELANPRAAVR